MQFHFIKFADDSVIVSFLNGDEPDHGPVVSEFTEKMTVDFRKNPSVSSPLVISDQAVEVLDQYKYLDHDWQLTELWVSCWCCVQEAHQRLNFYRKLCDLNVDQILWKCFIESILTVSFVRWFGSLSLKNRNQRCQGVPQNCWLSTERSVFKQGPGNSGWPDPSTSDLFIQTTTDLRTHLTLLT